jgi:sporulation protein YlmC with PRC-barrel domain
MIDTAEFDIGSEVACRDGVCGKLARVVIDPVARTITHLAVEPKHGKRDGRLVPIDRVTSGGSEIVLDCTKAQFESFEYADDFDFLPAENIGGSAYDPSHALSWPYYAMYTSGGHHGRPYLDRRIEDHDSVPLADVEIRRGDHVHATDGTIGKVHGLIIDPRDHSVTHFLLEEGHVWGHKTVAIPITAVDRLDDGVRLSLTVEQVRDLPPVDHDRRGT